MEDLELPVELDPQRVERAQGAPRARRRATRNHPDDGRMEGMMAKARSWKPRPMTEAEFFRQAPAGFGDSLAHATERSSAHVERLMADLRAAIERVKSPLAKAPGTAPPTTCWACRGPIDQKGRSRYL
jgi:hypothetical protein